MRNVLVLLAVVAFAAVPAMADKSYAAPSASFFDDNMSPSGMRASGAYATGFEPAEGFAPGPIGGQAGWTMFGASVVEGHVDTVNPAAGVQHLRTAFDPANPAGTNAGGFSPNQGAVAAGHQVMSVDIAISASGGANYDVVPQAPSQGFLSARVSFDWLGTILVLDDIGAGLTFIDTLVPWTPGVYTNLTIDLNAGANTIDYYYGGAPIYSSVAGVYAGTSMEQIVLFSDNWQNPGETGDFDNLNVTPEPATLALLALGGLAALRRRR